MTSSRLRSIGKITGAHGLQGEVTVKPWNDEPAWVHHLQSVFLFQDQGPVEMAIESARLQHGSVILKFEGISNRTRAEQLKGGELKAYEADLPQLSEDEYYADELVGMCVKSCDSGKTLGTVRDVLSSQAGDFLEVVAQALGEPVLVPFQDVFVPRVDCAQSTVFIQGLDSLFERV